MLKVRTGATKGRKRACRAEARANVFWTSRDGASAVEFALFAPIIILVLLSMIDIGLAIHERMAVDHVLRTGAQTALTDPGATKVREVMLASAAASFGPTVGDGNMRLETVRYCACPDNPDVDPSAAPACTAVCPGYEPPFVFYRLIASKPYDGMIIPDVVDVGSSVQVQIQ